MIANVFDLHEPPLHPPREDKGSILIYPALWFLAKATSVSIFFTKILNGISEFLLRLRERLAGKLKGGQ